MDTAGQVWPRALDCRTLAHEIAEALGAPTDVWEECFLHGLLIGAALADINRPWLVAAAHELQAWQAAQEQAPPPRPAPAQHRRFVYADLARQLIARTPLPDDGNVAPE
jgi:hypothetical protein